MLTNTAPTQEMKNTYGTLVRCSGLHIKGRDVDGHFVRESCGKWGTLDVMQQCYCCGLWFCWRTTHPHCYYTMNQQYICLPCIEQQTREAIAKLQGEK